MGRSLYDRVKKIAHQPNHGKFNALDMDRHCTEWLKSHGQPLGWTKKGFYGDRSKEYIPGREMEHD